MEGAPTLVQPTAAIVKHPFKVEVDKPERERGHYFSPEAFGQPEERGIIWARDPELMRQMNERRVHMKNHKEQ